MMKIKVLGSGCPTCKTLHELVLDVVKDESNIEVEYITDIEALIENGIMASPALMIEDKVVCVGRIPTSEEVKEYINQNRNE